MHHSTDQNTLITIIIVVYATTIPIIMNTQKTHSLAHSMRFEKPSHATQRYYIYIFRFSDVFEWGEVRGVGRLGVGCKITMFVYTKSCSRRLLFDILFRAQGANANNWRSSCGLCIRKEGFWCLINRDIIVTRKRGFGTLAHSQRGLLHDKNYE